MKELMAVGVMLGVRVIVAVAVGSGVLLARAVGGMVGGAEVGVEYVPHRDGVAVPHANWKMARMVRTVSRRFTGGNYTRLDKTRMRTKAL
jgi:hypothetical protein